MTTCLRARASAIGAARDVGAAVGGRGRRRSAGSRYDERGAGRRGGRGPSPRSRAPRSRRRLEPSAGGAEETRGLAYCSFLSAKKVVFGVDENSGFDVLQKAGGGA